MRVQLLRGDHYYQAASCTWVELMIGGKSCQDADNRSMPAKHDSLLDACCEGRLCLQAPTAKLRSHYYDGVGASVPLRTDAKSTSLPACFG